MMRPALLGKLNCGSNHKHADDDYDGLLVGFQSSSSLVDSPRSKQLMTRTVALSSSSTASVHAALSSALTEMNAELRSKTDECQAFQETVSKLAMSMHESDVRLEQALMENERLMLKLQAVCFLEKGEVSSSNSVVDAVDEQDLRHGEKPALPLSPPRQESIHVKTKHISATRINNHGNHGRNMILFPELKPTVSKTVTKMDAKQPAMACIITKQTLAKLSAIHDDEIREPVSENHADTTDDKHPSSGQRDAAADQVDGPVDVDAIIPSQTMAAQAPASTIPHAAFVRVLSERDEAQKLVKQTKKELFHRRKQVRQLQNELTKTKQLVELSSCAHVNDKEKDATMTRRRHHGKMWAKGTVVTHVEPMQWLRKTRGNRSPRNTSTTCYATNEQEDEMRDALVSRSEPKSHMYMEPFAAVELTEGRTAAC